MKKILCMAFSLLLALICLCTAYAEGTVTLLEFEELPENHRMRYEAEVASALANAANRLPGTGRLLARAKGDFNGYQDKRTKDGITIEYTVNNSVVKVGEAIKFDVSVTSTGESFTYTVGGLLMDANFKNPQRFNEESANVQGTTWKKTISYTPTEAGYINFVLVITDAAGAQVGVSTATVQIYQEDAPLFKNIVAEGKLAAVLSLNDAETRVGDVITATVTFSAEVDPVNYTGVWTMYDATGAKLEEEQVTGQCNAQESIATFHFDYWPMNAGKVQFVLTANDGKGNQIKTNTPYVEVQDGFYFSAQLDKAAVSVGESLAGTYLISGHECETTRCIVGWSCYDPVDPDKELYSVSNVVTNRSGKASFSPRYGETIEFFVRAVCDHYPDMYPAYDTATLLYGVYANLSLSASTVKSGNSLSLTYEVTDGLDPYQEILINGYSRDSETNTTYHFLQKTVTATEGTVSGKPYLGDQVYYEVKVTEKDGYVSTWRSSTIPLTGAPDVSAPTLTASVDADEISAGEKITLTYKLTGGSGTLNKSETAENYVAWKKLDGTVAAQKTLTSVSGTAEFTPEEDGEYICVVVLTDGYSQRVTWTSDSIYVGNVRLPGDANNDGLVNALDAMTIAKYSAGWENVTIDLSNADVTADGDVNALDAMNIAKYSAGWEGVELK